jgi:ABC-type Na+ efflux pump permease subunit
MDDIAGKILPIIFFGFFAFVLWSMFSKAGKGRMLGGTIIDTAKDEITSNEGIAKTALRAHVVEAKNGTKHVGLELSQNAKLAASMTPIKLSKKEAETLIGMLREVVDKT